MDKSGIRDSAELLLWSCIKTNQTFLSSPKTALSPQTAPSARGVLARPRPPRERAPRTRARNWWSSRRSSTSAATCANSGGWRWPACSTSTRGRSRSGSRTGGWSRRRTRGCRAPTPPPPPPRPPPPRPLPPPRAAPPSRAWVTSIWEGISSRPPLRPRPHHRTRQNTANTPLQASGTTRSLLTRSTTHTPPRAQQTRMWISAGHISSRAAHRTESCRLPNWLICSGNTWILRTSTKNTFPLIYRRSLVLMHAFLLIIYWKNSSEF